MYNVYLGGSAPKGLCHQNPWNVLVVQDLFNPVRNNSKDCCLQEFLSYYPGNPLTSVGTHSLHYTPHLKSNPALNIEII